MAEEAVLKIGVDSKDAEAGAKRVADALKKLGADSDKAEKALKDLGIGAKKAGDSSRKAGDDAAKASTGLNKMSASAKKAATDMDRLNKSAESAGRVIGNVLRTLAAGFTIRWAVDILSQTQTINNQFKLLSDNNEEVAASFNKVADIAKSVGAPLAETASLYSRLSRQAKSLKLDNEGVDTVMQSVAAGIKVSGQAASQLSGPLLQLQQGLAAGTFRAEEFNSVNEGMPDLIRAVEKAMYGASTATGKLRQEILAGNVSSQQFAEGLRKAAPAIQELADKMSLTIPQAIENVKTSILQWVNSSTTAQQVASALANAIQFVADNMNTIAPIVTALGAIWIATFTVSTFVLPFVQLAAQLTTVAGGFTKLFALIAANPMTLLVTAIAAVVAATVLWLTTTEEGQAVVQSVVENVNAAWNTVIDTVTAVSDAVANAWNGIVDAVTAAINRVNAAIDKIIAKFKAVIDWAKKALAAIRSAGGGGGSAGSSTAETNMAGGGSLTAPSGRPIKMASGGMFRVPGNGNSDTYRAMVNLMPGETVSVTPKKYSGPRDGGLTVRDIAEGVARGSYNIVAATMQVDDTVSRTAGTQQKIEYSTSQTYEAVRTTNRAAYEQVYAIKEAGKATLTNARAIGNAARYGFRIPMQAEGISRTADSSRPSLTGGNQSFGENLFPAFDGNPNSMGQYGTSGPSVSGGNGKYTIAPSQANLKLWDEFKNFAEQLFGPEGREMASGIKPQSVSGGGRYGLRVHTTNYQPLIQQLKNYETRVKKDQFMTDYKAAFMEARGSMDTFEGGSLPYGTKLDQDGKLVMKNSAGERISSRDQQAMAAARQNMAAAVATNNYNIGVDVNVNGATDADSFRPASSQIEMELANAVRNATARR